VERRLAAILAADVVGYSKLMGEDEAGTLEALRHLRREILVPLVDDHSGNIIKSMGDGWLVEFSSAGEATSCAIKLQRSLAKNQTISLRLGIHLGDVTFEDDDVFGDGVNIAARLQEVGKPGSVLISDTVKRSIDGKLAAVFKNMGTQTLKNIAEPVTTYSWSETKTSEKPKGAISSPSNRAALAVFPFDNMSNDAEQEFFADGIAEDIITNLSKVPDLRVIARTSTTAVKSEYKNTIEAGRILGAQFVLQGSIRQVGSRLRLSVQLVDTNSDGPIWAERYDRVAEDIFDLQDEIVKEIVTALRIQLTDGELASLLNRGTSNIDAWRLLFEAYEIMLQYDAQSMLRARELAKRACEIDPTYALAWGVLGFTYWYEARIGPLARHNENIAQAETFVSKALSLDTSHPDIVGFHVANLMIKKHYQEAVDAAQTSLGKNPGSADARFFLANAHHVSGDHATANQLYNEAKLLNPMYPIWYFPMTARSLDASGDQQGALNTVRSGLEKQPDNFPCLLHLASLLGRVSKLDEAADVLSRVRLLSPDFTMRQVDQWLMMKDQAYKDRFAEGVRKAGLPD